MEYPLESFEDSRITLLETDDDCVAVKKKQDKTGCYVVLPSVFLFRCISEIERDL